MDIWFCRFDNKLYYVMTEPGEAPETAPLKGRPKETARDILQRMNKRGHKIDQVGICPPDMLGLE